MIGARIFLGIVLSLVGLGLSGVFGYAILSDKTSEETCVGSALVAALAFGASAAVLFG